MVSNNCGATALLSTLKINSGLLDPPEGVMETDAGASSVAPKVPATLAKEESKSVPMVQPPEPKAS
jgi:hypothetical protein